MKYIVWSIILLMLGTLNLFLYKVGGDKINLYAAVLCYIMGIANAAMLKYADSSENQDAF